MVRNPACAEEMRFFFGRLPHHIFHCPNEPLRTVRTKVATSASFLGYFEARKQWNAPIVACCRLHLPIVQAAVHFHVEPVEVVVGCPNLDASWTRSSHNALRKITRDFLLTHLVENVFRNLDMRQKGAEACFDNFVIFTLFPSPTTFFISHFLFSSSAF
jgi:hypothetical protein